MRPSSVKLTKEEIEEISFKLLELNHLKDTFIHADMWSGEDRDRDGEKIPILNVGDVYRLRNKLEELLSITEKITDCTHNWKHEHHNWYRCTICDTVEAR